MAAKMKSIALLTTLLVVVLGSTTAAAAAVDDTTSTSKNDATAAEAASSSSSNEILTPYYLFRDAGCEDTDRASGDGGEDDNEEYNDDGDGSGDGYSAYPTRHDRRHNRHTRALKNKPWEEDENAITPTPDVTDLKSKALRSKCAKMSKFKLSSKGAKSSEVAKLAGDGSKSGKGAKSSDESTITNQKISSSKSSKASGGGDGDGGDIDVDGSDSTTTQNTVTQNTVTQNTVTQTKASKVSGVGNGNGGSNGLPWDDGTGDGYEPYPPSSPSTTSAPSDSPITPSTPSDGGSGGYEPYNPTSPSSPSPPPSPSSTSSPIEPSTPERTPKPTPQPTKPTVTKQSSSSCDALLDVRTSNSATLEFIYEAAISPAMRESVIGGMESSLANFAVSRLTDCDDNDDRRRSRLLQIAQKSLLGMGSRYLGELEIVGIDATSEVSSRSCRYFVDENMIEDTNCYVIDGGMTLYLSEHDSSDELRRRKLSSSEDDLEDFMEESTEDALEAIMDAMNSNDDPSPFLQESDGDGDDGEYSVSGLMGVRFISGETYYGEEIEGDNGSSEDDGDMTMGAATTGGGATIQSSSMETVGVSLLSVGLAAFVGLALIVGVRKRRRSNNAKAESYNEFNDDHDLEDDDKSTDVDDDSYLMPSTPNTVASTPPPASTFRNSQTRSRLPKSAYVVGEEGSVYTNATHDTRSYLNTSYESGNGNDDDQQVDVHHCTSAVCPICNGRETVFVSALEEDNEAATMRSSNPEGYEFRYNTATFGNRSFEYSPKREVSSPKFRNPSGIERPYVVDNTVEF